MITISVRVWKKFLMLLVHVAGILYGTMTLELGGQITIACEKTGYSAQLEFKLKVWLCLVKWYVSRKEKDFADTLPLELKTLLVLTWLFWMSHSPTPSPIPLLHPSHPPYHHSHHQTCYSWTSDRYMSDNANRGINTFQTNLKWTWKYICCTF